MPGRDEVGVGSVAVCGPVAEQSEAAVGVAKAESER